ESSAESHLEPQSRPLGRGVLHDPARTARGGRRETFAGTGGSPGARGHAGSGTRCHSAASSPRGASSGLRANLFAVRAGIRNSPAILWHVRDALLAGIAQRETRFVAVPLSSRAGLETAPLRLEFSRDSTDVPADTATTASLLAHHRAAGEIPWLRDRSAPAQAPASRASYFPLRWYAATAVMVAVAALFYAESNPSRRASPVTQSRPA